MANGWGGKRPGAGHPRKIVMDWQQRNLLLFQSVFTEDEVRLIAQSIKDDMKNNPDARRLALPYVIGAAPKEVTILGDPSRPLEVIIDAGQVDVGTGG